MTRVKQVIYEEIHRSINDALDLAEKVVTDHLSGPTGAESLGVRSQHYRSHVKRELRGGPPPRPIRARIYVSRDDVVYAPIHERGDTITPKTRKWLTIPARAAQSGLSGPSPRRLAAGKPGIRTKDFPGGFFLRRGNRLWYVMRYGKRIRRLRVLFLLVKQVTIPRRAVWAASRRIVNPQVEPLLRRGIVRGIRRLRRAA